MSEHDDESVGAAPREGLAVHLRQLEAFVAQAQAEGEVLPPEAMEMMARLREIMAALDGLTTSIEGLNAPIVDGGEVPHPRDAGRTNRGDVIVREVEEAADIAHVRRLVTAHGDARADVPGVESVYADALRMPGPYVPPKGGIWLACAGDTAIGCVALRLLDDGAGEVKRMFVDPEWRGVGVGRALLTALISAARARGYTILRLGTLDDMDAAQGLYRSLGFTPIERYRPDELIDTRFFELSLDAS